MGLISNMALFINNLNPHLLSAFTTSNLMLCSNNSKDSCLDACYVSVNNVDIRISRPAGEDRLPASIPQFVAYSSLYLSYIIVFFVIFYGIYNSSP